MMLVAMMIMVVLVAMMMMVVLVAMVMVSLMAMVMKMIVNGPGGWQCNSLLRPLALFPVASARCFSS